MLGAAAALATLGAGAIGVGTTFAAQNTEATHPMEALVQALANKFNVSTDAVQEVFDQQREAMQQGREQHEAEFLARAIADGKLTQEQADALQAKRKEVKALMTSTKDLTSEEARAEIKAKMGEWRAWTEEQGIDLPVVGPEGFGGGLRGGPGKMGGEGRGPGGFRHARDTQADHVQK